MYVTIRELRMNRYMANVRRQRVKVECMYVCKALVCMYKIATPAHIANRRRVDCF